jgi:EmrB/QacA subfamily drug resistance transporter
MGLAVVVIANDFSAINVALPTMEQDFDTNVNTIQWVVNAYALTFGVLIVTGGRLADMFGRRNAFFLGTAIFASMSALGGIAQTETLLIGARVLMGIGGALMWPAILGMTYELLPEEKAGLAGGIIIGAAGLGNAIGPLIGGVLTQELSWRWIFFLNVPIAAFAVGVTWFLVHVKEPDAGERRIDYPGIAAISVGLVSLLIALDQVADWGWTDPRVLGLVAAALVAFVVWVRFEARAREPLVDMVLMRVRGVWTVNAAAFLVGAGMYSSFILFPEFTETPVSAGYGFGASVTEAGLFLLPCTLLMLVVSPIAGVLAGRVGSRATLIAGALLTAAAFLLIGFAHEARIDVYLSTALLGAGIGLAFASLANLIVEAVPPQQTAVATGVNTVMRTLGGSVGGQVGASLIAGTVVASGLPTERGYTLAFFLSAGACLLAALASLAVPRPGRPAPAPLGRVATAGAD